MHAFTALPEGYRAYDHINLQQDKKLALRINLSAGLIMIALLVLGHFAFVPIGTLLDIESYGWGLYWLRIAVLLVGYLAYIVLHELTHAAVMKLFGAVKLRFGFTGLYAYAGSTHDYFDKHAYRLIALAPMTVWGVIFTVAMILVPTEWFWVFYFLQVGNLTGAAGDVFVTLRFWRYPKDILVRDTGVEMFVYAPEQR